jgi:hypothetical protein
MDFARQMAENAFIMFVYNIPTDVCVELRNVFRTQVELEIPQLVIHTVVESSFLTVKIEIQSLNCVRN